MVQVVERVSRVRLAEVSNEVTLRHDERGPRKLVAIRNVSLQTIHRLVTFIATLKFNALITVFTERESLAERITIPRIELSNEYKLNFQILLSSFKYKKMGHRPFGPLGRREGGELGKESLATPL